MRPLTELNAYRDVRMEIDLRKHMGFASGPADSPDLGGFFWVRSPQTGEPIKCIASRWNHTEHPSDPPWDHVSVSLKNRCPTWEEMEHVKRTFFPPDEVAFQLHVAESEHISVHPFCLHIWRPCKETIPMPPSFMVA